ncbi:hypothetical protein TCSYLVIO_006688 [Trypanosoma cruzi]|nr:hypothetical protein TCSYLVIO_006688 [Trypanosoma cruzi]
MYRCNPAVLICLPVLLFSASPSHTHTHISICTVLCKNVFGSEGRWLAFRAEMMTRDRMPRWPPLTMTVAVPSEHTSTHTPPCLFVEVIAAGAWSTAAAAGAVEEDGAPRNKRANPLDEITMAVESCFVALASYIAMNAASRRLTGCLHSVPFEALRSFIQCDITIIIAAPSLNGSECGYTNDGKNSDEDDDGLHRGADYLRVFLHESQEGLNAVPTIPGIEEPLAFALSPAVISAHALRLIHSPWSSRSSSRVVLLLVPRWPFRMCFSVAWRVI